MRFACRCAAMGNTSTKEKADHIDGGALLPHGVYSGPQDYDFRIVQRLILQRRLAPFYKGLEDWEDSEDAQEEKEKAKANVSQPSATLNATTSTHSKSNSYSYSHGRATKGAHGFVTESERDMRRLYQGAIECPICFLYYPRNINRTRCCDKPMCTECFVQLKRLESAPTESPACPYCVEPHFGVIYSPALLPSSLLSSPVAISSSSPSAGTTVLGGTSMSVSSSSNSIERSPESPSPTSPSARRRSTSHKSPEVVTADELRPDWNRRILAAVQRQPGSRRASTSSSVSNATFALGRRLAVGRQAGSGSNSRRSNSSAAAADYNGYLTAMRNMGTDLEELMIMEAMRQSLQDEHDRLAREAAAAPTASASVASSNVNANEGTGASNYVSGQVGQGQGSPRSMTGRSSQQSALRSSPLSSPPAPPSTASSSSTAAHPRATSLTSGASDDEGHEQDADSDTESEQDTPELLHNRAIRFAPVTPIPSGAGGGMPKHRAQEEPTNSPSEAV
ncbi:SNF1-interacting protein [Mortierella claussenii]|nr:SNF1-interacting protein [Mortierella claussenii]